MNLRSVDTQLPEATAIDYANPDEICGYQLLLCKIYEQEGGFGHPAAATAAIHSIVKQGHVWLAEVRTVIEDIVFSSAATPRPITLSALPGILDAYDLMFRICNGRHCLDYIRQVRLKAIGRWLAGDKSISETEIVLMILSEVKRDLPTLDKRYPEYALGVIESWIDELTAGRRFAHIPLQEAYRRLTYLLGADLFVYLGSKEQHRIKAQWVQDYTLTDDQVDALDAPTLWSYIAFTNAASHLAPMPQNSQEELYHHLPTLLSAHHDLHPFHRQALKIELGKYPQAETITLAHHKKAGRNRQPHLNSINQSW